MNAGGLHRRGAVSDLYTELGNCCTGWRVIDILICTSLYCYVECWRQEPSWKSRAEVETIDEPLIYLPDARRHMFALGIGYRKGPIMTYTALNEVPVAAATTSPPSPLYFPLPVSMTGLT